MKNNKPFYNLILFLFTVLLSMPFYAVDIPYYNSPKGEKDIQSLWDQTLGSKTEGIANLLINTIGPIAALIVLSYSFIKLFFASDSGERKRQYMNIISVFIAAALLVAIKLIMSYIMD